MRSHAEVLTSAAFENEVCATKMKSAVAQVTPPAQVQGPDTTIRVQGQLGISTL